MQKKLERDSGTGKTEFKSQGVRTGSQRGRARYFGGPSYVTINVVRRNVGPESHDSYPNRQRQFRERRCSAVALLGSQFAAVVTGKKGDRRDDVRRKC